MVFNNETTQPASYTPIDKSVPPNMVRLVEDSSIEKKIRFDEMSLPDVPDPKDANGGNTKMDELGLVYPMIRINDVILARKNIKSMRISLDGFIPTISLSLMFDDTSFMSKNMPKDGDIISLFMRTSTDALTYLRDDFMITSTSGNQGRTGSMGTRLSLSGKLFIPGFDSKQTTDTITGTSKTVMREVAKSYGIGFAFNDFDDTDDFQTWIRCRESVPSYLSSITRHSWKDDTSFFKTWVDLYYNICFVNVNKFLLSEDNTENVDVTFDTNPINMYNLVNNDSSVGNAKMTVKLLSNASDFRQTPFYIRNWHPVNISSSVSMNTGYSNTTYTYVHNQNIINEMDEDCFESVNNIPAYDQNKTDSYILLRGRAKYDKNKNPESEQARVNYDFVNTYNNTTWTGIEYAMSDDDKNKSPYKWSGNVHKNFNRAPYHNEQNINELNKLYIEVECEGLNLQIMRGERVPVYLVFGNTAENMMYNASSENDVDRTANRFYSGYYIVDSVEYEFNTKASEISAYTTKFVLKRREWPTPEAIGKENA